MEVIESLVMEVSEGEVGRQRERERERES